MNREDKHEDLIELGAVSEATRGGPWGSDDFRGSLMRREVGLTQDRRSPETARSVILNACVSSNWSTPNPWLDHWASSRQSSEPAKAHVRRGGHAPTPS
jgi:hypothetical protein